MRPMRILGLVVLTLVIALSGCSSGLSEDDAEEALRSAFEGDLDASNKMLCPEEQANETIPMPEHVVFKEVTCKRQGKEEMQCATSFQEDDVEHEMMIVFTVRDGHLCDAHVEEQLSEADAE